VPRYLRLSETVLSFMERTSSSPESHNAEVGTLSKMYRGPVGSPKLPRHIL